MVCANICVITPIRKSGSAHRASEDGEELGRECGTAVLCCCGLMH